MLSDRQAGALARRAAQRRGDGARGVRARRAWRRLTTAADRGDPNAIEAAWQSWLREPGDERWQALSRWRAPQALAEAADDPARVALREAPAETGDLDPVQRAVSAPGRGDQATALARAEREYLAGQLAARGDWERLWRLARDLPPEEAVSAVRRFGGWRPPDDTGHRLFTLMMRTGPEAVAAVATGVVARIPIEHPNITDVSFAADGPALAVAALAPALRAWADLHELPGGRRVRHFVLADTGGSTVWFGAAEGELVRLAEPSGLHQDWAVGRLSSLGSEPVTGRLAILLRHGTRSALAVLHADLEVIGHVILNRRKAQPTWLDAGTLAAMPAPASLRTDRRVWASGDGAYAAGLRDDGELAVHDQRFGEIARVLARPMADASPADLQAAATAQAVDPDSQAGRVIGVLAECLRHRFGSDVAVGTAAQVPGRDDIGPAAGGDRPC